MEKTEPEPDDTQDGQARHTIDETVDGILKRLQNGDAGASEELLGVLYHELHRLASRRMAGQAPDHTLQTTALLNEAFLRLFRNDEHNWKDRDHFMALAARAMRSVLVDHARGKGRDKRKPPGPRVGLDAMLASYEDRAQNLVELDEALRRLGERDPLAVRIVELRFFAGLTMGETARVLGVPLRSVERDWNATRAFLRRELS